VVHVIFLWSGEGGCDTISGQYIKTILTTISSYFEGPEEANMKMSENEDK
jgi:hypothetical protein